jgi:hypothetical protein
MKNLPKRSGECLFEIIVRRYETQSTMITSDRRLEDWDKLIGDVPSATAILDLMIEDRCRRHKAAWANRLENARKRWLSGRSSGIPATPRQDFSLQDWGSSATKNQPARCPTVVLPGVTAQIGHLKGHPHDMSRSVQRHGLAVAGSSAGCRSPLKHRGSGRKSSETSNPRCPAERNGCRRSKTRRKSLSQRAIGFEPTTSSLGNRMSPCNPFLGKGLYRVFGPKTRFAGG